LVPGHTNEKTKGKEGVQMYSKARPIVSTTVCAWGLIFWAKILKVGEPKKSRGMRQQLLLASGEEGRRSGGTFHPKERKQKRCSDKKKKWPEKERRA